MNGPARRQPTIRWTERQPDNNATGGGDNNNSSRNPHLFLSPPQFPQNLMSNVSIIIIIKDHAIDCSSSQFRIPSAEKINSLSDQPASDPIRSSTT